MKTQRPMRQAMIEISLGPVWVWVEDGLDARSVERTLGRMDTRELVDCMGDMDVSATFVRAPAGDEISGAIAHFKGWIHEDDLDVEPVPMPPTAAELEAAGQVRLPLEVPR